MARVSANSFVTTMFRLSWLSGKSLDFDDSEPNARRDERGFVWPSPLCAAASGLRCL